MGCTRRLSHWGVKRVTLSCRHKRNLRRPTFVLTRVVLSCRSHHDTLNILIHYFPYFLGVLRKDTLNVTLGLVVWECFGFDRVLLSGVSLWLHGRSVAVGGLYTHLFRKLIWWTPGSVAPYFCFVGTTRDRFKDQDPQGLMVLNNKIR